MCLQSHLSRLPAPISDYVTDLRGVLDNSTRVLQALVDCAAEGGLLSTTLAAIRLVQGLTQVCVRVSAALTTRAFSSSDRQLCSV